MPDSFGPKLRDLRQAANLTLGALARAMNISVAHLCDIERERRSPPSLAQVILAAQFLKVPPTELLNTAIEFKGELRLDLPADRPEMARLATALARRWETISPEEVVKMLEAIENEDPSHPQETPPHAQ